MAEEFEIAQKCVKIHCDTQSMIHLTNNQVYHKRTKYFDIRFLFIRDKIELKKIMVKNVGS